MIGFLLTVLVVVAAAMILWAVRAYRENRGGGAAADWERRMRERRVAVAGVVFGAALLAASLGAGAQYFTSGWEGFRIGNPQDLTDGVTLKVIDAVDLAFAGDTSSTGTLDVGTSYYISATFKTSSADPGKVTAAVSGNVVTVTTAAATTGTCSVIGLGL